MASRRAGNPGKFNRNQPLGMPIGSVRAILALALVGACVGLALAGVVSGDKIANLAELAVLFYFGSKALGK